MFFDGHFKEQLLAEHLDNINVSFTVHSMQEFFGGTAGNIAYGMALLGHKPVILGNLGRDGDRYLQYLRDLGVNTAHVGKAENEFSPGAYITTDLAGNQITVFNAGAMRLPNKWRGEGMDPGNSIVIISPGNLQDMMELPPLLRRREAPFIFDPGQSLPSWQGRDLASALQGARVLICNQYELNLMLKLMNTSLEELRLQVGSLIVTNGEHGSRLYTRNSSWHIGIPALGLPTLDPTGAGDAYRAGLLAALHDGKEILEACAYGSALAAVSVGFKGTQGYDLPPGGLSAAAAAIKRARD
jgi:adenosine kinase